MPFHEHLRLHARRWLQLRLAIMETTGVEISINNKLYALISELSKSCCHSSKNRLRYVSLTHLPCRPALHGQPQAAVSQRSSTTILPLTNQ
jgi:hypothetical protein